MVMPHRVQPTVHQLAGKVDILTLRSKLYAVCLKPRQLILIENVVLEQTPK